MKKISIWLKLGLIVFGIAFAVQLFIFAWSLFFGFTLSPGLKHSSSTVVRGLAFLGVVLSWIGIFKAKKMIRCICTKACDCQNPPPTNWDGKDGVYHTSEECPIHNVYPDPSPECPIHGREL